MGIREFLGLGTLAMILVNMFRTHQLGISRIKLILMTLYLTVVGVIGTMIMYFIESGGQWGGQSYYGAVFFIPILFIPIAPIFLIRYSVAMDFCAISVTTMLTVMKLDCMKNGCCSGMALGVHDFGEIYYFPSALVESINSFVILVILFMLERKGIMKNKLYPSYMIIYGVTRFILNYFRYDQTKLIFNLTGGQFWSLCSIVLGAGAYFYISNRDIKKQVSSLTP